METQTLQTIAGYVALAVPITVAITNLSKLTLEWLNQRHAVKIARTQQTHEITTHYLNRALDPSVPLAIRHQLLRFLATPDQDGSRLSDWAKSELERVQIIVEETNRAVSEAEKELMGAKTATEVAAAEKKLAFATSKKQSLLEPPKPPPISPAALRAGLIRDKDLSGLVMKNEDLMEMELVYRKLIGANFSGSKISKGRFQGSQLQGANFENADLEEASFPESDLRAASFRGANLKKIYAPSADANLENANLKRAIYNDETKWPTGFNPEECGAIKIA